MTGFRLTSGMVAALLLCGCHSSETAKWAACCSMVVVRDRASNPPFTQKILDLLRQADFHPDGREVVRVDSKSSEAVVKQDILGLMNNFLADRPKAGPKDYFLSLGMTCEPANSVTVDATRCEIEVPIQVRCLSTNELEPWGSPLPDELQKPLPARLHWQVEVSRSALLGTDVQVLPIPGGRLCHR